MINACIRANRSMTSTVMVGGIHDTVTQCESHVRDHDLDRSDHHVWRVDVVGNTGQLTRPSWVDPNLRVLQERGLEHERNFVAALAAQGFEAMDLSEYEALSAQERTLEAMRAGVPVIVQAVLRRGRWYGRPDLLKRVESPSRFGPWSLSECTPRVSPFLVPLITTV
jgi:hypothetical protein